MKNIFLLIAILSVGLLGCNSSKDIDKNKSDFLGTTWAMPLMGDSYNYFWLSCDSTFTLYDDEIENRYYGKFEIKYDTLILNQQYEDDYHKYGTFPIKVNSSKVLKFLTINDSTLLFLSYNNVKASPNLIYRLEQRFDCNSLNNQ